MNSKPIRAIRGDVHIDGESCTPAEAESFAARILVAADAARQQQATVRHAFNLPERSHDRDLRDDPRLDA